MTAGEGVVRVELDVPVEPAAAFDAVVGELVEALRPLGVELEPGPGGRVVAGGAEVGRVAAWQPGERASFAWQPADWEPETATELELRVVPVENGARVTLEHRGLGALVGGPLELAGWFARAAAAPLLGAATPAALGDWLTDRRARRPAGPEARSVYRDPVYHRPNFRAILSALALGPADRLLEVGCGGGAFLAEALRSGCRAAAVDHSAAMVRLALEVNAEAVAGGRLQVHEASADRLPFPDTTFTCAATTGVFGFLPDPAGALAEIRRVLAAGGRLALFTGAPELRGTPAAPEPMASRLRFYEDDELERLALGAGFADVRVERPDLRGYARDAGVPDELLPLFEGRGGQLLLARTAY